MTPAAAAFALLLLLAAPAGAASPPPGVPLKPAPDDPCMAVDADLITRVVCSDGRLGDLHRDVIRLFDKILLSRPREEWPLWRRDDAAWAASRAVACPVAQRALYYGPERDAALLCLQPIYEARQAKLKTAGWMGATPMTAPPTPKPPME